VDAEDDRGGFVAIRSKEIDVQRNPLGAGVDVVEKDLHGSAL
jgi:hypothetical protein